MGKEERRQEPRLRVDEPASLLVVIQGLLWPCRIVEISLAGCRMLLPEPFVYGRPVHVEVAFKLRGVAFRLAGVTKWSDGKGHVGIRFTDVTSRRMDELIEVLCETAAENAAKAVRRAAERWVTEESPGAPHRLVDDPEASAATVQGSASPREISVPPQAPPAHTALTAPTAAAKSVFSPAEGLPLAEVRPQAQLPSRNPRPITDGNQGEAPVARPTGRERRSEVRLKVETSAIILLVNVGSRLRGRILNLSLGGCRIRTEERFPVGIYTRVETEFRLDGLPFRLGGVVQAIQERNCVGIRFLDMSERKRQQVEQLIGELADLSAGEHADSSPRAPDRGSST
ncbi:MAG TPA: PilZ domain-containing protein [Terracidiphilus sp.]|nr:PilZ domain-containing protein [Terracidiphilus sp.]